MEAAKSAANEEMQENKHTDYIYMVTGDRLVISMNAELDHHLADEMRDVIDTIIEERGVRHLIFDFSKISFMDSSGIGLITAAVPQAPASSNVSSSSSGIGRRSTLIPMSSANCIKLLLVIEGRIEVDFGVI